MLVETGKWQDKMRLRALTNRANGRRIVVWPIVHTGEGRCPSRDSRAVGSGKRRSVKPTDSHTIDPMRIVAFDQVDLPVSLLKPHGSRGAASRRYCAAGALTGMWLTDLFRFGNLKIVIIVCYHVTMIAFMFDLCIRLAAFVALAVAFFRKPGAGLRVRNRPCGSAVAAPCWFPPDDCCPAPELFPCDDCSLACCADPFSPPDCGWPFCD